MGRELGAGIDDGLPGQLQARRHRLQGLLMQDMQTVHHLASTRQRTSPESPAEHNQPGGCSRVSLAHALKQGAPVVVGSGVARLNFQSLGVVRNGSVELLQAVMGEGPIVVGAAVPWVQPDGCAVVCDGRLKVALQGITGLQWSLCQVKASTGRWMCP